jgi:outer membrane protein assembly factor BamB
MRTMRIAVAGLFLLAVGTASWLLWPKGDGAPAKPVPHLIWTFTAPKPGTAIAAPCIGPDAIYFAAVHSRGFKFGGAVYSLDPATGKPNWTFDPHQSMLPTASSPLLADGRLYFGEGMHANFSCKFYCLDSARGTVLWSFPTTDHVEGGPARRSGLVIFPAGNDGLYAVDARTGAKQWNYRADLHIDSTPTIGGDRVYVGSGPSRKFPSSCVLCLNADTGAPVWRTDVPLPAWASPVLSGDRLFAGLGNGRLTEGAKPPETPAGAVACLNAADGTIEWTMPLPDAIFGQPLIASGRVLAPCRDGNVYGLSTEGRELYRIALGGPVIASPIVAEGRAFAVSESGRILCFDPADGCLRWQHDLPGNAHVFATPRIAGRRLILAYETRTPDSAVGSVSVSCFELPGD